MDNTILLFESPNLNSNNPPREIMLNVLSYVGGFDNDHGCDLNIVKKAYVPQKGDKIFFLPQVNIPRIKFKNVALEYGIKTVRDITQANVFFGNAKSNHDMTTNTWSYKVSKTDFQKYIDLIADKLDDHTLSNVETALEFYTNQYVAVPYNVLNHIVDTVPNNSGARYSTRLTFIKEEYKEEYLHLMNLEIYDEASVIDMLNGEEATVIDETMYDHLREMFKSSDTDNHVLAMEIMANSKYTESLIYLELLFYYEYYQISNCHTKNHVNFKSLLSYLDKNKNYMSTDIDDIAKSLINKGQFTTDKIDIMMKYLSDVIQNRGDSDYFAVKSITIKPDQVHHLNANYTHEVIADFPEPEIEISEEDIETAISRIERKELKLELIALEEESAKEHLAPIKEEEESINHQINTNEPTDIDWF